MARLIDADLMWRYAWSELQRANKRHENEPDFKAWSSGVAEVIVALAKDMPTVDAVEVVRCKDCRFSELDKTARYKPIDGEAEKPVYRCFYHWNCSETVSRNHFCSHGERREGE